METRTVQLKVKAPAPGWDRCRSSQNCPVAVAISEVLAPALEAAVSWACITIAPRLNYPGPPLWSCTTPAVLSRWILDHDGYDAVSDLMCPLDLPVEFLKDQEVA